MKNVYEALDFLTYNRTDSKSIEAGDLIYSYLKDSALIKSECSSLRTENSVLKEQLQVMFRLLFEEVMKKFSE